MRKFLLNPAGAALLAVLVAVLLNGVIFAFGWNLNPRTPVRPAFAPPGWGIGLIWTVLVAGMAVAAVRLHRSGARTAAVAALVLLVLCFAYPFYALARHIVWLGLAGNIGTGLVALLACLLALRHDRVAAGLLGLVVLWISYATVIVVALMRMNP